MRQSSRRWVRPAAWSLAGCTVLILIAAMVLLGLNAKRMGPSKIAFDVTIGLAAVVYAGVGRLITGRVQRNAVPGTRARLRLARPAWSDVAGSSWG